MTIASLRILKLWKLVIVTTSFAFMTKNMTIGAPRTIHRSFIINYNLKITPILSYPLIEILTYCLHPQNYEFWTLNSSPTSINSKFSNSIVESSRRKIPTKRGRSGNPVPTQVHWHKKKNRVHYILERQKVNNTKVHWCRLVQCGWFQISSIIGQSRVTTRYRTKRFSLPRSYLCVLLEF